LYWYQHNASWEIVTTCIFCLVRLEWNGGCSNRKVKWGRLCKNYCWRW